MYVDTINSEKQTFHLQPYVQVPDGVTTQKHQHRHLHLRESLKSYIT